MWGFSSQSRRALVVLVLACAGCSGEAITESCGVAGRQRSCACTGHAVGIQTCQLDGTWDACTCYSLPDGAGAGGSGGAGGTSSRVSGVERDQGGRGGRGGEGGRRASFPFTFAGRPAER